MTIANARDLKSPAVRQSHPTPCPARPPKRPAGGRAPLHAKLVRLDPKAERGGVSTLPFEAPSRAAARQGSLPRAAKRALDLTGAVVGLVVLSPVLLVIALLVRLSSPGPILFRQTRLGKDGRPFPFLKFRTMFADAEQRLREIEALNESAGGVLFKMRRDPRVTPVGRFLRRSSLDELPQLINVIRGEMSLVGPRPLQLRDCELLKAADPEGFARRLTVLPGLTGAWQVGGRSETDAAKMLQLDIDYVENWLFRRDLLILWRTVGVVLRGSGAY